MFIFNDFCNDVQGKRGPEIPWQGTNRPSHTAYTGRKFIAKGRGDRREKEKEGMLLRETAEKKQEWAELVS